MGGEFLTFLSENIETGIILLKLDIHYHGVNKNLKIFVRIGITVSLTIVINLISYSVINSAVI